MSTDVIVIGVGGFGREALDVIEAHNAARQCRDSRELELQVIGFADDNPNPQNLERLEKRQYRYLGTTNEAIANYGPHRFLLAVGEPSIKNVIHRKFIQAGWKPLTVVHPAATIGSHCVLGEGNIICAGAQLSTNVLLGRHVHINPNATIGHDTVLEDFVSVNPGAVISGEVTVQRESLVGASSVILQGLNIGNACTVGASACVVRDVEPGTTVIGVPARPLKQVSGRVSISDSNDD